MQHLILNLFDLCPWNQTDPSLWKPDLESTMNEDPECMGLSRTLAHKLCVLG